MTRYSGVVSRGIRMPLIKEGTDIVPVIADTLAQAAQAEGFIFKERAVVGVTESLVARSQGHPTSAVSAGGIKKEFIDSKIYHANAIGSDEVGTGDYFGPIVVTSAYVAKENIPWLEELGVKDSKKMNDEKILQIVPQIIKKIPYKSVILSNKEYNDRYSDDNNMNKLKAILHNKVLIQLTNEIHDWEYVIVDQFTQPFVYFNYLKNSKAIFKNITFLTKGEDKSLAVACASLISRFIFLKEFNKISESLNIFLPKGASDKVDEIGVKIVQKYGFDILKDIAKLNFKNTEKIQEKLL